MTSLYRMHGARCTMEACQRLGIVLITAKASIYCYPEGRIQRYPAILDMMRRYRLEIIHLLDNAVD